MEYNLFDRLTFGKYRGYFIFEIYQFQPSYIEYLILNTRDFQISKTLFKTLELPTPFREYPIEFNGRKIWVLNLNPKYDYIKGAYQYILEGNVIPKFNFKFSELAVSKMLP